MDSSSSNDKSKASPAALNTQKLPTNLYPSCLTLIGVSFTIFGLIFLTLYSCDFWFPLNVSWLGLLVILLSILLGHLLLIFNESKLGCSILSPFTKGAPLFVYRKWLTVDKSGITFGNRHIIWSAIDEVNLNFWGTLCINSKSLCGPEQPQMDIIIKIPFEAGTLASQQKFIEFLKQAHPEASINKRLENRLQSKDVWSIAAAQLLGVFCITALLIFFLDVGQSTFEYLQMMKQYYLAETSARDGKTVDAEVHIMLGDHLRHHPFPFSFINQRLVNSGKSGAAALEARSNALWLMDKKYRAINTLKKALRFDPKSYRLNLHLARYFDDIGQNQESLSQIQSAIDNHPNSLLPRFYMISYLVSQHNNDQAAKFYNLSIDDLQDSVFGKEPIWPPGGNRFINDTLYKEDMLFILNGLLKPSH